MQRQHAIEWMQKLARAAGVVADIVKVSNHDEILRVGAILIDGTRSRYPSGSIRRRLRKTHQQ